MIVGEPAPGELKTLVNNFVFGIQLKQSGKAALSFCYSSSSSSSSSASPSSSSSARLPGIWKWKLKKWYRSLFKAAFWKFTWDDFVTRGTLWSRDCLESGKNKWKNESHFFLKLPSENLLRDDFVTRGTCDHQPAWNLEMKIEKIRAISF